MQCSAMLQTQMIIYHAGAFFVLIDCAGRPRIVLGEYMWGDLAMLAQICKTTWGWGKGHRKQISSCTPLIDCINCEESDDLPRLRATDASQCRET